MGQSRGKRRRRRRRRNRHANRHAQLKSSSQAVLDDDDLLTLILLRVPWKALMSMKSVSKQWLSLIASPYFIRLRSLHPLPISAFFFHIPIYVSLHQKLYFVHLEDLDTPSPFSTMKSADTFNPRHVNMLRSCNGIFLCCSCSCSFIDDILRRKRRYYVCNPCTNQVDTLPKHPCPNDYIPHIDLIFDPSKSLHYKVISFFNIGEFYIYSSETGTWRSSLKALCPAPRMREFKAGVYWNGGMHWLSECSKKQPSSDGFYFNVEEERLQTFPSPPMVAIKEQYSPDHSYFGESQGHLHYAEVCPYDPSFNVYEMMRDYSGWFVKYQIDLVPVSKIFPIKRPYYSGEIFNTAVASLVRRENFKEDSFLVLELPGQIIHYNLVDRSFKVIWNFVVDLEISRISLWPYPCGDLKAWPYNQ